MDTEGSSNPPGYPSESLTAFQAAPDNAMIASSQGGSYGEEKDCEEKDNELVEEGSDQEARRGNQEASWETQGSQEGEKGEKEESLMQR